MRWIPAIVGPLLLAGAGPTTSPGVSGAIQTPAPAANAAPADLTLQKIHMIETRDGSVLWELRADRAEVRERDGYTILSRVSRPVEATLYSTHGKVTCTSNRVTVDLTTKDVRMEGEVFARSDQGMELRTEVLRWMAGPRRLQTDQSVVISRGGLVSRGRGLEAETDLERVRIFQNITSQLQPGGPKALAATGSAPGVKSTPSPVRRGPTP